ncbi:hypothetical protein, partial [Pseudoalteromonas rubra]|uniref:hypothetical protein n=1 Tax=Pseudoalteromonas rubra TaxID=43658 RepID=UPI001BB298CE
SRSLDNGLHDVFRYPALKALPLKTRIGNHPKGNKVSASSTPYQHTKPVIPASEPGTIPNTTKIPQIVTRGFCI